MSQEQEYEDFVPAKPAGAGGNYTGETRNYPTPKGGARKARISLIVDIGIQNRDDSYKTADGKLCNEDTPGAIATPQKPAPQVVVFADLVNDTVDYGGEIGKAHYRLLLNNSFNGVIKGINHQNNTPPKDAKGNLIKGADWTMHPQNMLTKLAKATGTEEIIVTAAINRLLNKQFMAEVEVKEKASGKNDADGNEIVYKNVNFKGASKVAAVETDELDEDGNPIEAVPEFVPLKTPAKLITFMNAKKDDVKFIRPNIRKMIKLATNYAGSAMQKAIEAFEAFEAENAAANGAEDAPAEKPKAKPAQKPKADPKPVSEDEDLDVPF